MMKDRLRNVFVIGVCILFLMSIPLPAGAQDGPRELRRQACERVFPVIIQCQLSAGTRENNCDEVSGIISSPETKELLTQRRPDGATDTLVDRTIAQVADMCRDACQSAKEGRLYKTAQDWMDSGGCTIQVTP
jgi:hypothetical protein